MKYLLLLAFAGPAFCASTVSSGPAPSLLDRPVENLRLEKAPLPAALRALARSCQTNVVTDPDVTGEVTIEVSHGTLRSALTALTAPGGYCYELTPDGITVRNRLTVLYAIDYPQLTRSGSGSASITLGGANNGGVNGTTAGQPLTSANGQNQALNNSVSDATQVSISQDNQNTFWTGLETELKAMLKDGDQLVLNKFSGVAQITAPVRRHETVRAFIDLVNHRINQQVVQEFLRRYSIVSSSRMVVKDYTCDGVTLKQGEMIILPSAFFNLDESRPEAEKVDFARKNKKHITFGSGIHACAGALLAREEIRIFLEEWLTRLPQTRLDPERPPKLKAMPLNGAQELWLKW